MDEFSTFSTMASARADQVYLNMASNVENSGFVSFLLSSSFCFPVTTILLALFYVKWKIRFVGKDEQLFVEKLTELLVLNGPQIVHLPLVMRRSWKDKAIFLSALEYVVVQNDLTGVSRVEQGPQLLFLNPYDHASEKRQVISLKKNEFIRFIDQTTGKIRCVYGEKGQVVPGPNEVNLDKVGKRAAMDLKAYEYVKIEDKNTGQLRVERGEQLVFLKEYEEWVGQKRTAVDLKVFEYSKIEDRRTGSVRVERGEQLVFLDAYEEFVGPSKQTAVEVDEETAVLIRNKRNGQQSLVKEKKLFIPSKDEHILEVRKLIKLADYEACIVRGKDGADVFYFGSNDDQRSFFLPPHSELVKLLWSRGRRREYRDLVITKIDLRPMYMSFEFNCRTSDNVELVLEGSFFWEVKDLQAMVKFTNNTTGDICNHARSKFIEKVSKVTLQVFMSDFNRIAMEVHQDDNTFYTQRGCMLHSLEVTGYHCADDRTATILGQIIQETTNRMNRLQQQESENEVQLFRIKGDIDEERAMAELLRIQTDNNNMKCKMEGLGEAEKVNSFMSSTRSEVPDLHLRVNIWNVLRKKDALHEVSSGNAKLFFTPNDCNLSIENHEHEVTNGGSEKSFERINQALMTQSFVEAANKLSEASD